MTHPFDKGATAYKNGDDHLFHSGDEAFQEGFKDAWYADHAADFRNHPDNAIDTAWEGFVGGLPFTKPAPISPAAFALGILTMVGFGMLMAVCLIFDDADIVNTTSAFWSEVAR